MKFNCFIIINLKLINGFQESFLLSCIDSHKYVITNSLAALFKTLFAYNCISKSAHEQNTGFHNNYLVINFLTLQRMFCELIQLLVNVSH